MTAAEVVEQALEARYVGKRIDGPSWDAAPMVVARVRYTHYSDHVTVTFVSNELLPRGRCVSMHDRLPEVLP